jgi:hypothetical protein
LFPSRRPVDWPAEKRPRFELIALPNATRSAPSIKCAFPWAVRQAGIGFSAGDPSIVGSLVKRRSRARAPSPPRKSKSCTATCPLPLSCAATLRPLVLISASFGGAVPRRIQSSGGLKSVTIKFSASLAGSLKLILYMLAATTPLPMRGLGQDYGEEIGRDRACGTS